MNIALVHGLWNRGWSMAAMAKRLRGRGHHVVVFSYPTRGDCLDGHADELYTFLVGRDLEELHLVGHSMGGLVILNMLSRYEDLPPGRIVLVGTPVKGSDTAKRLGKLPGQKFIFGKVRGNLLEGLQHTPQGRETGVICGTRALGLGQIAGRHDEPSDGTVTVSETELEGRKDSIEMAVAHTQMLFSAEVVDQAEYFLIHGKFEKDGN
ncbi:MAG: alpha/beta hydrolase [Gammaproteobacteria bacterium]|nr:alpha/beta hydrolase [Gammaproteobacteria bacterium]